MLKIVAFLLLLIHVYAIDEIPDPPSKCGPEKTKIFTGLNLCCYYDTELNPIIGYGFNLLRPDAEEDMQKYNLNFTEVKQDCKDNTQNNCLLGEDAEDLFDNVTYPGALGSADTFVPGLPTIKRAAIADLAHSIGNTRLQKFVKMKAALRRKDWLNAALELKNSLWCHQVGKTRCDNDYYCIAGNR